MTFVPNTAAQRAEMLKLIGVERFEDLLVAIPPDLIMQRPLQVPEAHGEVELGRAVEALTAQNLRIPPGRVFAGGGSYMHHVPSVVDEISSRGEFYTAYTPYQPEVSQGYLQSIYEYQSYICMLTGMDISNASGYDGATTLADAVLMSNYVHKGKRKRVLFAPFVNAEFRNVVDTYAYGMEMRTEVLSADGNGRLTVDALREALSEDVACVIFQYPDCLGYLEEELEQLSTAVRASGALAIFSFYPYAAGLLRTPGELGADIVCGEAQCFGNYVNYGGPYCGFLACREEYVRVLPGRLIGRTVCQRDGEPGMGFVMTLQAREQHIRRNKAMSNICSNQALLALRACIYLGSVGRNGFRQLAALCHANALEAHEKLVNISGVQDAFPERHFFNEFTLRFPGGTAAAIRQRGLQEGMLCGIHPLVESDGTLNSESNAGMVGDCLTFAFTEIHTAEDSDALARLVWEVLSGS
ncbi:aminomethyl-transferring glycine dehydrogenase subunit GcvPA [bacterium]|nr:aminomethyl-transferring glycine dehydrogenase subunit GcvPA [bacterium]